MTTAFLSSATNLFGKIKPEIRARLEAVIANPSQDTWEDAYCIIIDGASLTTLWQAWAAIDPLAPKHKPLDDPWPRVPDQLTIYRALRYATQRSKSE